MNNHKGAPGYIYLTYARRAPRAAADQLRPPHASAEASAAARHSRIMSELNEVVARV